MRAVLLALMLFLAGPALAVQPDEVLSDPVLETRAREISKLLRCPVCQGESIDESNAPISADLRRVVRERLVAGDTDAEVIAFVTDRFGEFVLFLPDRRGANLILWIAGPLMLVMGLGVAWVTFRRRAGDAAAPLSAEEEARLKDILGR